MVNQAVTLFALFSLAVAPERPPRNPPMPNGPQPEFVMVQAIDPVQKRVEYLHMEVVTVPITVPVNVNGQTFTKTAYRQEYRQTRRTIALAKDAVHDAGGKKVTAEEALKRLKVGVTVLVATQPVDPLYLRVIRPDTLILIGPAAPARFPIPVPFPKDKRGERKDEPVPKR
jgi:hypothetical protein